MSTPKNELRAKADQYARLGWSVIPIRPGTKKPALQAWKPYSEKAPSEAELQKWFNADDVGIAVCLGEVSGNLVCRDFDDEDPFFLWLKEHEELASSLPIAKTSRGYHVYFRANPGAVELVSPTGSSIVDYGEGELRGGGIAVLPPSIHESGHGYRWLIEPGEVVPLVEDLVGAGMAQAWLSQDGPSSYATEGFTDEDRDYRRLQRSQKITDDSKSQVGPADSLFDMDEVDLEPWKEQIADAIEKTLPTRHGQRNKCIFEFARRLQSIGPLAGVDPCKFEGFVRSWHEQAKAVIRTESPEETLSDFVRGWGKVKFPFGTSRLNQIFNEAMAEPFPKCSEKFSTEKVRKLIALCKRLHWTWDPVPFPLACRPAGELLGVSHLTASKWLYLLVQQELLSEVMKGGPRNRRASRYRYLGD
jgi:hypothetical protein